jgi:hypothetical protein
MAGPYPILYQVSNSYKVELSESIKIYNIFSSDCLYKATDNLLSGQKNELPLPIQVIIDREYKVQDILVLKAE